MDREQIREWIAQDWVKNPAGPSDTYVFIEDIHNLLAAIDDLTAENAELKQKAAIWTAQAAIWRTSNVKIVNKLIQSTSSYEDRIDDLEARNAKLEAVVDVAAECYNARLDSDMPVPWWRLKAALDALTKAVQ